MVKRDKNYVPPGNVPEDNGRKELLILFKKSVKQALKYYGIFVALLLVLDFSVDSIATEMAERDVEKLIANESDDFQKIVKIHEFVYSSLRPFYNDPTARRLLSFPLIESSIEICRAKSSPHLFHLFTKESPASGSWAYVTKMGNCEEHAEVFATLLKLAGFEARVVRASGEDHAWTEVMMNGEWIRVDASIPPSHPWYENESYYEEHWNHFKISAVITENGEEITENYTDTGTLIVHVTDDGEPLEGAYVGLYSWNPVERNPKKYKNRFL